MAYDEALAKRIEKLIAGRDAGPNDKTGKRFTRKEMFGGVGYMYNGNMCVGVHKTDLIIRYDPKSTAEITLDRHVRPFEITGRPMKGWSLVSNEGVKGNALDKWFKLAFDFVKTLPQKK